MNNLNLRKIFLLLILPFIALLSNAQVAKDLLGKWVGIHYLGTPPSENKGGGGIGSAPFYDSCKIILNITEIQDSLFRGNIYEYMFYDEAGTYYKAKVDGIIRNKEVFSNPTEIIESKFSKYSSSWCSGSLRSTIKKNGKSLIMESRFIMPPPGCYTGPSILYKVLSANETQDDNVIEKTVYVSKTKISKSESENKITASYKKRNSSVVETIEVESDSITLEFYDNGIIDGDSISVFLNGELQETHKRLTGKAFTVPFKLDIMKEINEVSMFAENLGTISPNTAVMIVKDLHKSYSVFLSSSLVINAVVRIKRRKV